MSADNYYWITKRDGKWAAFMRFASCDYEEADRGRPDFESDKLTDAIGFAQSEYTEYGFSVDPRFAKYEEIV